MTARDRKKVRRGGSSQPELIPLFQAAGSNDVAALRQLLDAGADPNAVVSDVGNTPLWNACFSDSVEAIRLLLDHGADPNQRIDYTSPIPTSKYRERDFVVLMMAQSKEAAQALIDAGADVNVQDADGVTPLIRAAARGQPEVVRVLLAAGASAATRTAKGLRALEIAQNQGVWFRDHGSDFKEGHSERRIAEFEDVCDQLVNANDGPTH